MSFSKFEQEILEKVKKIPKGKVTTYKEIAGAVGNSLATRAVGNALNKNKKLIKVPCHRVVKSNGKLGEYKRGAIAKQNLLKQEGIIVINKRILNFNKILYRF